MSKQYPECPVYNHNNCKDYHNPKLCAMAKKDKICLKKTPKSKNKAKEEECSPAGAELRPAP